MDSFAFQPRKQGVIRRHKVVATVLGFVLAFSGGALAAWFVNSNVTGFSKVTSLAPFTSVDISATVTADMSPGATTPLH